MLIQYTASLYNQINKRKNRTIRRSTTSNAIEKPSP